MMQGGERVWGGGGGGWKRNLQYGDFVWKREGKGPFARPGQNWDKMKVDPNEIS